MFSRTVQKVIPQHARELAVRDLCFLRPRTSHRPGPGVPVGILLRGVQNYADF